MKNEVVIGKLDATGIHREEDSATPISGARVPLPYMIVRQNQVITGDDAGRIHLMTTEWIVALFSANRDPNLECRLAKALQGVGKVTIKHFPDGTPYQTNFEFKTTQVLR